MKLNDVHRNVIDPSNLRLWAKRVRNDVTFYQRLNQSFEENAPFDTPFIEDNDRLRDTRDSAFFSTCLY